MPIHLSFLFSPETFKISVDIFAFFGNVGLDTSTLKPSFLNVSTCLSTMVLIGLKILFSVRVNAFLLALPLSVKATFFPLKANNVLMICERKTLCKSATASILSCFKSEYNFNKPKNPLCLCLTSTAKKSKFRIPSKKGLKKGRETTVIFTFGFCSTNALITGTVIATSPMADIRITAICWVGIDKSLSVYFLF